ncbi:RHS repeat-associated core domain-containing protein [Saccharothrix variisporea]|uniref:hypothetical protein n=1 Tax=Saccharothrix variisporea TaxID=543527 RepID=UPI000EAD3D58|nr:hypothetical protein [Saccharothrix variisporea]
MDPPTAAADPLGLGGGYAPHGYVRNPGTWFDPLGLTGGETRIGQNGTPLAGDPESTCRQQQVVDDHIRETCDAIRRYRPCGGSGGGA